MFNQTQPSVTLSPNEEDDISKNFSNNCNFEKIINVRLARRSLLKGSIGYMGSTITGIGLTTFFNNSHAAVNQIFKLGFSAVAKNTLDTITLAQGYRYSVLYRLGDPINPTTPAYANDGTDSAESFNFRAGDHHDGMAYFGLNATGSAKNLKNADRGLLCMNHENITQIFLHTQEQVRAGFDKNARIPAQIDKEVNAHGVSIVEIHKKSQNFIINKNSSFNRRITAATPMELSGPLRGDDLAKTQYSPDAKKTRGTYNNCANGITPWGTYLTCEENWASYFKRLASTPIALNKTQAAQNRYMGTTASSGTYGWANPIGDASAPSDLYRRWSIVPTHATAAEDYRNIANTFGYVVEIDPFSPTSTPRKRSALGRFAHEGAKPAQAIAGKPIVYYMGDDSRGEYIYKYVSTRAWNPEDAHGGLAAGDKYLDDGKLYAAKFNAEGTGQWLELSIDNPLLSAGVMTSGFLYTFTNQADVLVHSRIAADGVGATPMDRPEWTDVHPITGEIYITLTNNRDRGKMGNTSGGQSRGLDAANPRYYDDGEGNKGNPNGHIIRIKEDNANFASTTFVWDIYLFGAETDENTQHINLSALTDDNDFSSPDGLAFSHATPGLMWIETDDSAYLDTSNCMLLAAIPGRHGDGGSVSIRNTNVPSNQGADQVIGTYMGKKVNPNILKRFLIGPNQAEVTGITETPDGKTLFINIQHPGEDTPATNIQTPSQYSSHWPDGDNSRPRSATLVITKNDNGVIGS